MKPRCRALPSSSCSSACARWLYLVFAADAPAPAQRVRARYRDHDRFSRDLHVSEFWHVVEGCQHEREVQLATTHPVDVLFRTSRLWDDLDAGVPPLVLTHDPF